MTSDTWNTYRSSDDNCAAPLGSVTSLTTPSSAVDPFGYSWDPGYCYTFSQPLPNPPPEATATDQYNQIAWYENNVWAFSCASAAGVPELSPPNHQQYARNTIAANVRGDLDTQCSMLFNVPSAAEEPVAGAVSGNMLVNTAQAIICEYPNNAMAVTTSIPVEAFGFTQGHLALESNSTQPAWFPGALTGPVTLNLINTGTIAQVVTIDSGQCCLTRLDSTITCDANNVYFLKATDAPPLLIDIGESVSTSLTVFTKFYGNGYCNVSVGHLFFDGNGPATSTLPKFVGQISFSAPVGPPVTFSIEFSLFLINMERTQYLYADSGNALPGKEAVCLQIQIR